MSDNFSSDELNDNKFFHVEGEYNELTKNSQFLSPNDYLLSVRNESKKLPCVTKRTVQNITPTKLGISYIILKNEAVLKPENEYHLSDVNFQIVNEFENLRNILHTKTSNKSSLVIYNYPDIDDKEVWLGWVLGKNFNSGDNKGHLEPLTSIICGMSQKQIIRSIEYLADLDDLPYTHLIGRWIYALLSVLSVPLNHEAAYLIRSLARHLIGHMKNSNDSNSIYKSMNAVLSIIIYSFKQIDLINEL